MTSTGKSKSISSLSLGDSIWMVEMNGMPDHPHHTKVKAVNSDTRRIRVEDVNTGKEYTLEYKSDDVDEIHLGKKKFILDYKKACNKLSIYKLDFIQQLRNEIEEKYKQIRVQKSYYNALVNEATM